MRAAGWTAGDVHKHCPAPGRCGLARPVFAIDATDQQGEMLGGEVERSFAPGDDGSAPFEPDAAVELEHMLGRIIAAGDGSDDAAVANHLPDLAAKVAPAFVRTLIAWPDDKAHMV